MILYHSTFHVQHATKAIIKLFKQYVSFINFIVWPKKYVFIFMHYQKSKFKPPTKNDWTLQLVQLNTNSQTLNIKEKISIQNWIFVEFSISRLLLPPPKLLAQPTRGIKNLHNNASSFGEFNNDFSILWWRIFLASENFSKMYGIECWAFPQYSTS